MKISLAQSRDEVCLIIHGGTRATRAWLTQDEAQHLSNRLQVFAKGGENGFEDVIEREDQ